MSMPVTTGPLVIGNTSMMINRGYNFIIPFMKDDLCHPTDKNQYVVQEVLVLREVVIKLQECKKIENLRLENFFDLFDLFYSILCVFGQLDEKQKKYVLNVLMKFMTLLEEKLSMVLRDDCLSTSEKNNYCNLLKMILYIAVQLIECFEIEIMKSKDVIPAAKGRKKSHRKVFENLDWDGEKLKIINLVHQICLLPLKKCWDPPIPEEDLVNLINISAFKFMENPNINQNKIIRAAVIDLLGASLKAFGNSLGLSLKIIQTLQHFEHSVSILIDTVEHFVNQDGSRIIINEIIREIGRMDMADMVRDTSGTKALCQFLIEFTERQPRLIYPSISILLIFLDGDAYTMRNCVLSVFTELVSKTLSEENMDDKSKELRDQLLDKLEDHIHDVNAFVRSKVLQLWQRLCAEQVIPLDRQGQLLRLIRGRIMDKSSQVRKNAILFVTAFLQGNPFASKLSLKEMSDRFNKEMKKLKEMAPDDMDEDEKYALETQWKRIVTSIKLAAEESESESEDESVQKSQEFDLNSLLDAIRTNLKNKKYIGVLLLIKKGLQQFKDHHLFAKDPLAIDEDPLGHSEPDLDLYLEILKNIFFAKNNEELITEKKAEENLDNKSANQKNIELTKQQVLVRYLSDCVEFSEQIHQTIPTIASLLTSKVNTDVLEAIDFFVTGYEFGVAETVLGIRKMLLLIWSKESSIKDGVVNAYKRLYLNPVPKGNRSQSEEIVFGLSNLLRGLTLGELMSLEELIAEFVKNKELTKQVFNVLWQQFSNDGPNFVVQSHSALILLAMAARADPEIVKQNLDMLIDIGLGQRSENDFLFAKDVCALLFKLSPGTKPNMESEIPPYRLPQEHQIFQRLEHIIINGFEKEDRFWTPFALQAVKVIYRLAEHPDLICQSILLTLVEKLRNCKIEGSDSDDDCPSLPLVRFVNILGEIALCQLIHLDIFVFCEMKRRAHLKQLNENKKAQCINKQKKNKNKRRSALNLDSSQSITDTSGDPLDVNSELVGAEADDSEADFIAKICETELLHCESLFGKLSTLLIGICSNPAKYKDLSLRVGAAMALGKFMLLSPEFCENNLALFMTLLEKSSHPLIRANVSILVGDLAIRFPNLVEPWTKYLYARLHDDSVTVRKNTLTVLSHLILNDLLKVKSQISDLAICLVDKELCILQGARTFFHELAKKGNSIYNILPDIMSHLSDPDCGTTEENFRSILKYLLKFVEKDRQLELLVEKICLRFNLTRTERQDRDLAYCLSLIPFNERCLRKLQENSLCFAEKMRLEAVYESFLTLLTQAKKKEANAGALLEELEQLVDGFHQKGMDKENMEKAKTFANKLRKPATKKKVAGSARKVTKRKKATSSSDSDCTPSDLHKKPSVCAPKSLRPTTNQRRAVRKTPALTFSDSSDESS